MLKSYRADLSAYFSAIAMYTFDLIVAVFTSSIFACVTDKCSFSVSEALEAQTSKRPISVLRERAYE